MKLYQVDAFTEISPAVAIRPLPSAVVPWWSRKPNKNDLLARQVSARSSLVRTEMKGFRVIVGGLAATIVAGDLLA